MAFPFCNQVDIVRAAPRIVRERRHWDEHDFEQTERRVGAEQCPKCGLWWPAIEQPDMWTLSETDGKWDADGWWGGTVCEQCSVLMINQPDGRGECYDLSST